MSAAVAYGIAIAVAAATLYGVTRFFGRERMVTTDEDTPDLRVISRLGFGRGRELVIVDIDGRRILLGAARGQWTALADLGARRRATLDEGMSAFEAEITRAMNPKRFGRGRRAN